MCIPCACSRDALAPASPARKGACSILSSAGDVGRKVNFSPPACPHPHRRARDLPPPRSCHLTCSSRIQSLKRVAHSSQQRALLGPAERPGGPSHCCSLQLRLAGLQQCPTTHILVWCALQRLRRAKLAMQVCDLSASYSSAHQVLDPRITNATAPRASSVDVEAWNESSEQRRQAR